MPAAGKLALLGVAAVAAGAFVPPAAWIGALRTGAAGHDLLLGASLFRIGLVVLGCYAVRLGWLGVFTARPAAESIVRRTWRHGFRDELAIHPVPARRVAAGHDRL